MRDLKECTAEVFRRSEARIKQRKKARIRVLTLCIPLCLVVAVWSVMILPAMLPASRDKSVADEETNLMDSVSGTSAAYIQVEVNSLGNGLQSGVAETDTAKVAQLFDTVQAAFVAGEAETEPEASDAAEDSDEEKYKNHSQSGTAGYRIVFTAENGSQAIYTFSGDTLVNESTKQEATLSAQQRSELLTALDSVITGKEDPA